MNLIGSLSLWKIRLQAKLKAREYSDNKILPKYDLYNIIIISYVPWGV